jgi:hypothetical protein
MRAKGSFIDDQVGIENSFRRGYRAFDELLFYDRLTVASTLSTSAINRVDDAAFDPGRNVVR